MSTIQTHPGIFSGLKETPDSLCNAAAILGAENPPREALSEAIETLWHAGLTRQSGARQGTILKAVRELVFEVFDHPQSEIDPADAARNAAVRLSAYMKFDREGPAANGGKGGKN